MQETLQEMKLKTSDVYNTFANKLSVQWSLQPKKKQYSSQDMK